MKTINLSVCIIFGLLSVIACITAIISFTLTLGIISGVLGAVSYLSYQDYKDEKQNV
jgi:hypothetical protein